jgi:hypothetical protein
MSRFFGRGLSNGAAQPPLGSRIAAKTTTNYFIKMQKGIRTSDGEEYGYTEHIFAHNK